MADVNISQHEPYVQRCIELAQQARERGDRPFGSLIVHNGQVIAEDSNRTVSQQDVTAHAEINAIRQACHTLNTLELTDCTLYTSAEPCFMCSYAIRESGIGLVVIGARGYGRGGVTSKHPILIDEDIPDWRPSPDIIRDVLLDEATAVLQSWLDERDI